MISNEIKCHINTSLGLVVGCIPWIPPPPVSAPDPDNDLIWGYETDWTRSASSDMRTFSPDVRMQTLQYEVIFILLNTR